MTRQDVLNRLAEEVGKPLARMATPNYWCFEDMDRAAGYAKARDAARLCYRRIDGGQDPVACLRQLKQTINGIEGNALRNLINDLLSK